MKVNRKQILNELSRCEDEGAKHKSETFERGFFMGRAALLRNILDGIYRDDAKYLEASQCIYDEQFRPCNHPELRCEECETFKSKTNGMETD